MTKSDTVVRSLKFKSKHIEKYIDIWEEKKEEGKLEELGKKFQWRKERKK